MEKIPVLFTTFNRLEYTKQSLPALIENTRDIGEIYIVDNCSTDGTVEYLESIDDPIVVHKIFNSKNIGVCGAMNQFFEIIEGKCDYFAKVDNDTVVPKNWLETLLLAIENSDADIIQAKHRFIIDNIKDWGDLINKGECVSLLGSNLIYFLSVGGTGTIASAKTIHKVDETKGLFGWSAFQRFNPNFKSAFYDGVVIEILDIVDYNVLLLKDLEYHISVGRTDSDTAPFVSIIVPVIREDRARDCIAAIKANADLPEKFYEIVTEFDKDGIGCPKMVKKLTERTKYDLVMFLGDDTRPEPGFMSEAISAMSKLPGGWGLVGLYDEIHDNGEFSQHWLAHKKLLDHLENREFFHTGYVHQYCDCELTDIAKELGRYIYARSARVVHDHPIKDKSFDDEHYYRVYSQDIDRKDHKLYLTRRKARGYSKLGVGLPLTDEKVYTTFLVSWTLMDKPDFTLFLPKFPGPIEAIRNNLVVQALRDNCTQLIMMDTDQNYPTDTIPKLMSHGKDVVAINVHRRYPPFDSILLRGELGDYHHVPDDECFSGELIEIDATGCGCMLFNTDVFLDIPYPWFETYRFGDGRSVGEDVDFCSKLKKSGYDIYADTSIKVGHISHIEINRDFYLLYKEVKQLKWRPPPDELNDLEL